MSYFENKPAPKKRNVKAILRAALELQLLAVLLFAVILAVVNLLHPAPPETVLLYTALASYVAAFFCVAAERATL